MLSVSVIGDSLDRVRSFGASRVAPRHDSSKVYSVVLPVESDRPQLLLNSEETNRLAIGLERVKYAAVGHVKD